MLAQVAGVFGAHGVSIRSMEQEGLGDEARLVFITHVAASATCRPPCTTSARSTRCAASARCCGSWAARTGDAIDPDAVRQHPGSAPVARVRRRPARRAWRPTAGSTCPRPGRPSCPSLPGLRVALRRRRGRGHVALRRAGTIDAPRVRARWSPRPTPRSTTPTVVPDVPHDLGRRRSGSASCSGGRRSPSRTSPCSWSGGSSTTS